MINNLPMCLEEAVLIETHITSFYHSLNAPGVFI